ncbi:hypothetical protein [Psittacicella hinzii]|uniref:Uncharacterized protein n=1 Tax=Psittacicella hinzii TaxID=2028575 RepID=A0A3A1YCD4_9GAMM|nr:hypothetical protein [Psittacicella hinzii]RIY35036.1 hypothetical protein CKF58_07195 [Psittacicella hinzii]
MTEQTPQQVACPELLDLKELATYFAQAKVDDQNLLEQLDKFLVTATKINQGLQEYEENHNKVAVIAGEINQLRQSLRNEEQMRNFFVQQERSRFYNECLKPNLDKLTATLDSSEEKFAHDENLKANFDGIALILKSFEDNLIGLGLHQKPEAPEAEAVENTATEEKAE